MPSRKRTVSLFDADAARAVNSQMSRQSRSRATPLPKNLLHAELQASEPRAIRKVLALDVKEARARMIDSASTPAAGKRAFWNDKDLRKAKHTACGAAKGKKALRFLTAGSRDLASNELPKCYQDPKGARIYKGRGIPATLIKRHYQLP